MSRFRSLGLLEGLLDDIPDCKKDNGADDSAYNLAIPLCPEWTGSAKFAKQPSANETAGKTDEDVPDKTALVFNYEEASKPASNCSNEQSDNDVHGSSIKIVYRTNIVIFVDYISKNFRELNERCS